MGPLFDGKLRKRRSIFHLTNYGVTLCVEIPDNVVSLDFRFFIESINSRIVEKVDQLFARSWLSAMAKAQQLDAPTYKPISSRTLVDSPGQCRFEKVNGKNRCERGLEEELCSC